METGRDGARLCSSSRILCPNERTPCCQVCGWSKLLEGETNGRLHAHCRGLGHLSVWPRGLHSHHPEPRLSPARPRPSHPALEVGGWGCLWLLWGTPAVSMALAKSG